MTNTKHRIKEVWIAEGKRSARTGAIQEMAGRRNIPVLLKKNKALSDLLPGIAHQGIVALIKEGFNYVNIEQLVPIHPQSQALLIALDHITDEGNLGSIIRTAVYFGVQGLIIPKDRSAGMTATVLKRSSGAYVHLPVSKVVNIARTLDLLKKRGFWIIGTSGKSRDSIYDVDWDRPVVLVLGNEQRGLCPSVRKICDQEVGIPVSGRAESLNVSVAGGVILSEIVRQRKLPAGDSGKDTS